jgi:imidazoleglycerol phosphate synthase cyclase subunit
LRDAGDPAEQAARYADEGADELVLLDVSATPEGRSHGLSTVRAVRGVLNVPLTVGGGVRTVEDAARLLDAGADKVGVNTAAVLEPALIDDLASRFGAQCIVLACDARQAGAGWEVVIRSGTHGVAREVVDWCQEATGRGAGEILLTSWDRDGTGAGFDLRLVQAVRQRVRVPIVASGGAAHVEHLVEAARSGADAVLAAGMFHDRRVSVAEAKQALADAGWEVRL